MGNVTNLDNWSARERLIYIERLAYWRGSLRRADICGRFGVSVPQASADIAGYLRLNPGSLTYDLRGKRYVVAAKFQPRLWAPEAADAMAFVQGERDQAHERIARIDLPYRHIALPALRAVVRSMLENMSVEIYYYSVNSGTAGWRWIAPRAFAHDGYRWHARAWCFEDASYKDFVLGRISKARSTRIDEIPLPKDHDWATWVRVRFRAHPALSSIQRAAIERDFAIEDGVASFRVRKAMLLYTLVHLGLETSENQPVRRLELVEIADNRRAKRPVNRLARAP